MSRGSSHKAYRLDASIQATSLYQCFHQNRLPKFPKLARRVNLSQQTLSDRNGTSQPKKLPRRGTCLKTQLSPVRKRAWRTLAREREEKVQTNKAHVAHPGKCQEPGVPPAPERRAMKEGPKNMNKRVILSMGGKGAVGKTSVITGKAAGSGYGAQGAWISDAFLWP
jgi:hypothetical protein